MSSTSSQVARIFYFFYFLSDHIAKRNSCVWQAKYCVWQGNTLGGDQLHGEEPTMASKLLWATKSNETEGWRANLEEFKCGKQSID